MEISGLKIALYHGEFREISEAWRKVKSMTSFSKDPRPTIGIFTTEAKRFQLLEIKQ